MKIRDGDGWTTTYGSGAMVPHPAARNCGGGEASSQKYEFGSVSLKPDWSTPAEGRGSVAADRSTTVDHGLLVPAIICTSAVDNCFYTAAQQYLQSVGFFDNSTIFFGLRILYFSVQYMDSFANEYFFSFIIGLFGFGNFKYVCLLLL